MNRITLAIIVLFTLLSCGEQEQNIDFQVNDKFALVIKIADMYFMDVYISRAHKTERDSVRDKLENEFEQLHAISVKELDEYMTNLKKDKKLFGEIMDSVSVILTNKPNKK